MRLIQKITLLLCAVFAASIVLNYWALKWAIEPSFLELEAREAEKDVERVLQALEAEVRSLQQIGDDWGSWIDAYKFVQGGNEAFIEDNLYYGALDSLDLNAFYFLNLQGEIAAAHSFGLSKSESPHFPEFPSIVFPNFDLISSMSADTKFSGVVATQFGPMLVHTRPVLKSDDTGPPAGALLMGRLLSDERISELRRQTQVNFEILALDDPAVAPDVSARQAYSPDRTAKSVSIGSNKEILARTSINDPWGNGSFVISATIPREITAIGKSTILSALLMLLGAGLVTTLTIRLAIKRVALTPIADLTHTIFDISRSGKLESRSAIDRDDEIGVLSKEFNTMLDQLASATGNLLDAKEKAEQASVAKSDFLARMSHEIRTPMNGVIGMADLLSRARLGEREMRFVKTIKQSADALLHVINDILDFSKIEAGKLQLTRSDFEIHDLVGDTVDMFVEMASAKELELTYLIAENVPSFVVGDSDRLRQILVNIIGNAVKYTEKGGVLVRVGLDESSRSKICLLFEVEDSGIGIPLQDQEKLFEPFEQVDGTSTRRFGGTGLGLSIARQLVALMNGEISVESVVGRGTLIRFTVDLQKSDRAETITEERPRRFSALRVLVADDQALNREILSTYLKPLVYDIHEAADGDMALQMVHDFEANGAPFDVVFADMDMPGLTGLELAREIKDCSERHATSVILLSSVSWDVSRAEELAWGLAAVLQKPARPSDIKSVLERVLTAPDAHETETGTDSVDDTESLSINGGAKILVAEDNPVNQEVIREVMGALGFDIALAGNGIEAVDLYRRFSFDLILMDVQMPELDGLAATRQIRELEAADPGARTIPIVALTAGAMEGDADKCRNAGMDDYLSKPLDHQKLVLTLQKWLQAAAA